MKRTRVDGQLSKDEYFYQTEFENTTHESLPGVFAKATPNTLASRKMVVGSRVAKDSEYKKLLKALNDQFLDWIKTNVNQNDSGLYFTAAQDYIDYVGQLKERYLKGYGEVLTFGSGDCGQLAHGVEEDDDLMVKFPRVVYSLRDKRVCTVACGGLHNAVVTEYGQVYTWGCDDDGSLGRKGDESVPFLVDKLKDVCVINIACGDGQTIAVSSSGDVYGWGCYKDKEGKKWFNPSSDGGPIRRAQDTPMLIQGVSGVLDIACGSSFNVARCKNGAVYSWGIVCSSGLIRVIGECGELARQVPPLKQGEDYNEGNITRYHLTPGFMYTSFITASNAVVQNSREIRNAKAIGCGAYHSLLVLVNSPQTSMMMNDDDEDSSCCLFTTGLNNYGQLGVGDMNNRAFLTAVHLSENVQIMQVKGGVHHSLALASTGEVFAWGRSDSGQLGLDKTSHVAAGACVCTPEPVKVGTDERVLSITCGGNHNLALTTSGAVYTWGYGEMLALGHGQESDENVPRRLAFRGIGSIRVTQISGGGQHSAIIGTVSN